MDIRSRAFVRARFVIGGVAVLLVTLVAVGNALVPGPGGDGSRIVTVGGGITTVPGPTPALLSGASAASDPPSTFATTTSSSPPTPKATTIPKPTTTLPYAAPAPQPTTTVHPPISAAAALPTTTVPSTTIPANSALVTLEGAFDSNVLITFAGRTYNLAPNQDAGPLLIPAGTDVRDTIKVARADDPACSVTQTAHFFDPGQKYWVWAEYLVGGTQFCPRVVGVAGGGDVPQPRLTVTQYGPGPPLSTTG
jgi:hypothetical protein